MGMYQFKRDNELVTNVNCIAEALPSNDNGQREAILELVRHYESTTFSEWKDKDDFEVRFVEDMVNDFGFADDKVAETMANSHPTLQQSFMRLCVKFIKKMSEKEYWDGRNEASVKTAQKIMEALDGQIWLPCI